MNVLKKCCYRSMKENPKRTVVTIIGIILATALITAVASMAVSFRASMILLEKKDNGDFHYLFAGVTQENIKYFQNNQNVEKIGLAEEIGYAPLEGCMNPDKPYVYIRAVDASGIQAMSLELIEGRMPQNGNEIVISRHIRSNGSVDLRVGDTITFQIGERVSEGYFLNQGNPYNNEETFSPIEEKTYTIVGMIERPNYQVEFRSAPGYSVFTHLENAEEAEALEIYASYTENALKNSIAVTAGLLGISPEEYATWKESAERGQEQKELVSRMAREVWENRNVVRWIGMHFSDATMNMLYGMSAIAILIIITSSVFCIRNSFVISLTEKMKLYGRLASIGTTSRQQRKIVYYEAGLLAAVGIPLGILGGISASAVVVQVTGGLMESSLGVRLVFCLSFPAIILAAVLALITVYLSAYGSARKAAGLTPISAIRGNSAVKISRRELRCPRVIDKLFGIGGKLAYRNLQRAKAKYRTTVISIVVSVAVFIGVYSFIGLVSFAARFYYESSQYQLLVYIYDENAYEDAKAIAALEGIERAEIMRRKYFSVEPAQQPILFRQEDMYGVGETSGDGIIVVTLGEEGYDSYCRELGVEPDTAKDKAIVIAYFDYTVEENGKRYHFEGELAEYGGGDIIEFTDLNTGKAYELPVLLQTDKMPICLSGSTYNMVMLIVSENWWEENVYQDNVQDIGIYICCEDADALEETIRRDCDLKSFNIYNYDAEYRSTQGMYLAVAIFLYGFIVVVSLIGVTNIFNTVTTNIELRAPEFAMCKSVGMTGGEFRRMFWLEGLFYGGKGLLLGIPLGILISLGFHKAMGEGIVTKYRLPVGGILMASAAVFILMFCIMRYSMKKFYGKNIIETIRNENI